MSTVFNLAYQKVHSQQRPRFNRRTGHAYKPLTDKKYEESLRAACIKALPEGWETDTLYMVYISISLPLRRFSMMDVDNISKAVLDGITGAAFDNDNQVVELTVAKTIGSEGLNVTVAQVDRSALDSTPVRGDRGGEGYCESCGAFGTYVPAGVPER